MWYDGAAGAWKQVRPDDLDQVADGLLEKANARRIWLFRGEMGSGKTTLIKRICGRLGVTDPTASPTFSIVNEYLARGGQRVYHFDFYRIRSTAEAIDIGTEEYFYSGHWCLVEWPDKVATLIPAEHAAIAITVDDENHRTIALSVHDGKEEKRI